MDTAKNDTTAKDEIQPIFKGVTYYTNGSISQKVGWINRLVLKIKPQSWV